MQKGARTKPRAAKSWKASDAEAPVAPRQGGDLLKLQADAYLAAIIESSDDAIISKTLDGTISSWNKGAERIFGYQAEEAIGKPIYLLIPPELAHEEVGILARLRRGKRIDHYETVRVRKDGTRLNVSLTVSPV